MAKPSYSEIPYQRDKLQSRKSLFDSCDSHSNHYLSMAEAEQLLDQYDFGGKPVAEVKRCIKAAFDEAKNYGGDQTGAAADFVEHREFRIFLEIFVKKLEGKDDKPDPRLEDLKGKKGGTTTCCGGCVIA
eukprot:CAMPEP_0172669270 /NCGR_PEP_ID=MMETSP1074-20121228/9574_1 /TAXON_ID=2916 /ORGANISM="Ceratium fusus, Strain PA161109" /LENGTH=129 /DNA_ID=CAMNT_0013486019 /DNA_START=103 /DNA_END=492 /DNA_ORIENTATION=-